MMKNMKSLQLHIAITLTIFCMLMTFKTQLIAQTTSNVDPCQGSSGKSIIAGEDLVLFNLAGVNLNNYDWNDGNVNCHINLTIESEQKRKTDVILGNVCLGLGLGGLVTFIPLAAFEGGFSGAIVLSTFAAGGGIALYIGAGKNKKQRDYHLNEVGDYFREHKLNTN
jgi:hypothetical protein